VLSTVHRLREQWRARRRDEAKEKKKEEGRADLRWLQPLVVLLEATSGGAGGSRWLQPLLSLSIFFSLFF